MFPAHIVTVLDQSTWKDHCLFLQLLWLLVPYTESCLKLRSWTAWDNRVVKIAAGLRKRSTGFKANSTPLDSKYSALESICIRFRYRFVSLWQPRMYLFFVLSAWYVFPSLSSWNFAPFFFRLTSRSYLSVRRLRNFIPCDIFWQDDLGTKGLLGEHHRWMIRHN